MRLFLTNSAYTRYADIQKTATNSQRFSLSRDALDSNYNDNLRPLEAKSTFTIFDIK